MSINSRAFDLLEELKADIDYEFRGVVTVVTNPKVDTYSVTSSKICVNPEQLKKPVEFYYSLMIARKQLRIYSRLGKGNLWIGSIIYSLSTSFLWFPIFFSYFWYSYQKELAKEVVRATVLLYGMVQTKDLAKQLRDACKSTFVNRMYWLWPEQVDEWLNRVHYEVLLEEGLM